MVNAHFDTYKIKATVESTIGSVYNIRAVISGDLDFAIAQSDTQYRAVEGLVEWSEGGSQADLRSVFSIHPESITLVATEESAIMSPNDLKGNRVNLGSPGTGQLQNVRDLLTAFGIQESELQAQYAKPADAPGLLLNGDIDAFFFTVGHPNTNIKEATSGSSKVRLTSIRGKAVEDLLAKYPYYTATLIPMKEYPNALNTSDIPSFGVRATLVTTKKLSDDVAYAVTKEVFENFDSFKALHPAFQVLTKQDMLTGLSAPIHKGSLTYYRQAGLIDFIDPALIVE